MSDSPSDRGDEPLTDRDPEADPRREGGASAHAGDRPTRRGRHRLDTSGDRGPLVHDRGLQRPLRHQCHVRSVDRRVDRVRDWLQGQHAMGDLDRPPGHGALRRSPSLRPCYRPVLQDSAFKDRARSGLRFHAADLEEAPTGRKVEPPVPTWSRVLYDGGTNAMTAFVRDGSRTPVEGGALPIRT